VVLSFFGCNAAPVAVQEVTVIVPQEVTREVTREVEIPGPDVEITRLVEVTQIVETVIEVTPAPPPLAEVFYEGEFTQDTVSDNIDWGECDKAVFVWESGDGYVGATLYKIGDDRGSLIVNKGGGGSGETLEPLDAGTYYWEIETDSYVRIRGECR
jgi:hypothetical protein